VHAGEGRAPGNDLTRVDVGLFNRPADDGAVVCALARDRERFARLPVGTADVAVVEGDGDEALPAEALGEGGSSSRPMIDACVMLRQSWIVRARASYFVGEPSRE
jgi:hypothetical protein